MENETEQRQKIVAIARTWLGTPFVEAVGLKRCGVDCGYLLARVYEEAGIWAPRQEPYYQVKFYLQSDSEDTFLKLMLDRGAHEISESAILPGDFVFYNRLNKRISHAGLIESWPDTIINSIDPPGVICSSDNEGFLRRCKRRFFSAFGGA